MPGIRDRKISDTSFAIIDFETTGLRPGSDRAVEVSVVRIDPQERPKLVLDTLINPQRRVSATEIHGITDADVVDAPKFGDIAPRVAEAVSGAVVAAYNVYFDMSFLRYEMEAAGFSADVPHFCVMYMRPMLGMGNRCCLDDACSCHGITHCGAHMSSADAIATAELLGKGMDCMSKMGVNTFGDLSQISSYKFVTSFDLPPLAFNGTAQPRGAVKSRSQIRQEETKTTPPLPKEKRNPIAVYWDSLVTVISDLNITSQELQLLQKKREECQLADEQVRALHARVFAHAINQFVDDRYLDSKECSKLNRLHQCLAELGWAPGQA